MPFESNSLNRLSVIPTLNWANLTCILTCDVLYHLSRYSSRLKLDLRRCWPNKKVADDYIKCKREKRQFIRWMFFKKPYSIFQPVKLFSTVTMNSKVVSNWLGESSALVIPTGVIPTAWYSSTVLTGTMVENGIMVLCCRNSGCQNSAREPHI